MGSRWWLASASFPVVAGLLCAMTMTFHICTTSQGWYETIDLDGTVSIIAQPAWTVVLKAVSLALGAVAYCILLFTMMSKRDPVMGFSVTILCWITSAALLFSVIGVATQQHLTVLPEQILRYTQNFFYGIFAAGLYVLISVLLAVYTVSVRSATLTHEDRQKAHCTTVVLRAITFDAFLLGGAGVYAAIEGWSFMDAVYWADYTILTIGIGNITPQTHLGRSLLFPYATSGIATLGLVISSIASFSETMRELHLRFKIKEAKASMQTPGSTNQNSTENSRASKEKQSPPAPAILQYPRKDDILKLQRIKQDFYRKRRWLLLGFSVAAWFLLWLVSAAIFRRSERSQDWSYFESLYFTYTSLTTIGYGDFYPTSNFGKAFFVAWSLLAVPVLTNLVNAMGQLGLQPFIRALCYVWRLGPLRLCPWQGIKPTYGDERGRNRSLETTSYREPSGLGADTEGHVQGSKQFEQLPSDLRINGRDGSSADTKHIWAKSIGHAVQQNLLLSEEIGKLVSIVKDEITQLDLCSEWAKVLPLLHPERDDDRGLLEAAPRIPLHDRALIATDSRRSERSAADTEKEVLWMLKLLAEKLCSNLREELYRAQEWDGTVDCTVPQ